MEIEPKREIGYPALVREDALASGSKNLTSRIYRRIETIWKASGALAGFQGVMRSALEPERDPSKWVLLPGMCCQAAGGDPLWADDVTAAWFLLYTAAHLMDSVEDQDDPDPWWASLGPGAAVNAASGLFFCASLALNNIHDHKATRLAAREVIECFYKGFLRMCSGQHLDLIYPEPTLDQYWKVASAKSGDFFSLACRTGARLALDDPSLLDGYSRYGYHLGLLIQIMDDLEDLHPYQNTNSPFQVSGGYRSLPVVYAMEVSPPQVRDRLRENLMAASHSKGAAKEVLDLLEQSGATLYLMAEIERHRELAMVALEESDPRPPARDVLVSLLQDLTSPSGFPAELS